MWFLFPTPNLYHTTKNNYIVACVFLDIIKVEIWDIHEMWADKLIKN